MPITTHFGVFATKYRAAANFTFSDPVVDLLTALHDTMPTDFLTKIADIKFAEAQAETKRIADRNMKHLKFCIADLNIEEFCDGPHAAYSTEEMYEDAENQWNAFDVRLSKYGNPSKNIIQARGSFYDYDDELAQHYQVYGVPCGETFPQSLAGVINVDEQITGQGNFGNAEGPSGNKYWFNQGRGFPAY